MFPRGWWVDRQLGAGGVPFRRPPTVAPMSSSNTYPVACPVHLDPSFDTFSFITSRFHSVTVQKKYMLHLVDVAVESEHRMGITAVHLVRVCRERLGCLIRRQHGMHGYIQADQDPRQGYTKTLPFPQRGPNRGKGKKGKKKKKESAYTLVDKHSTHSMHLT